MTVSEVRSYTVTQPTVFDPTTFHITPSGHSAPLYTLDRHTRLLSTKPHLIIRTSSTGAAFPALPLASVRHCSSGNLTLTHNASEFKLESQSHGSWTLFRDDAGYRVSPSAGRNLLLLRQREDTVEELVASWKSRWEVSGDMNRIGRVEVIADGDKELAEWALMVLVGCAEKEMRRAQGGI